MKNKQGDNPEEIRIAIMEIIPNGPERKRSRRLKTGAVVPGERRFMEYIIMHETSKYMRLRLRKGHITASQAEILRYVLEGQQGVSGIRIYPASGSISFFCEKERGKILYKLKRLQFHNVEMFARELDNRISTEELSRRKLSPEVKNRLRRKVLIETVADLLMPVPLQVGYHAYQLVTLRDL